jgi:hypothetical protein
MLHRSGLAASVLLVSCLVANGKDKKKVVLPADVLRAHTVLVMVDPKPESTSRTRIQTTTPSEMSRMPW